MDVLRAIVVDDHDLVGSAIAASLRELDGFDVVGLATTIDAGVALAARSEPDLVVTDVRLPDGEVTDHLDRFRAAAPGARVLVLSGLATEQSLLAALRAGADGYVAKSQPMVDLVDAAQRVVAGELVFPGSYIRRLLEHGQVVAPRRRSGPRLTPREIDVVQLLAHGLSTVEVAEELVLSVNTIRNHLAAAMQKLGVASRLAAVAEAIRLGVVTPPAAAVAVAGRSA